MWTCLPKLFLRLYVSFLFKIIGLSKLTGTTARTYYQNLIDLLVTYFDNPWAIYWWQCKYWRHCWVSILKHACVYFVLFHFCLLLSLHASGTSQYWSQNQIICINSTYITDFVTIKLVYLSYNYNICRVQTTLVCYLHSKADILSELVRSQRIVPL